MRPCAICSNKTGLAPWLARSDIELVQCPRCGFIFSSAVPNELADASFYETEGSNFYLSEDKLRGDFSSVRYAREIRLFQKFCARGSVLDVGCSTGGFLHFLEKAAPGSYDASGTDVAHGALEHAASRGVNVIRNDFFSTDFPAGFDAITFWAVLEHVLDPAHFLRRAAALLNPGGLCFVLVPNVRSLATRILGAKYRYILPQHVNYFSMETLCELARRSGFSVRHRTTMHFNPLVIARDWVSGSSGATGQERAELLVKTNALKSNPLLAPAKLAYSAVERMLGAAGLADNLAVVLEPR